MNPEPRPEDQRLDMGVLFGAVLSRWLRLLLVTAVVLAATFGVLLLMPRQYESTAAILVESRSGETGQGGEAGVPDAAAMSRQIELLRSRDTLLAVIDRQNLRSEPEFTGMGLSPLALVQQLIGGAREPRSIEETALHNLGDRLHVARTGEAGVISIGVRSENPELAARLANDIAEAHVVRRTAQLPAGTEAATAGLESEIARLRLDVQEADEAVAAYRLDNDLFTGTVDGAGPDQQLAAISNQIASAQERRATAEVRARLLRELIASGQPLDGVQEVRNSAVIQQLNQTRASLQGELAQRSSTLLPNHPTMRALVAQIGEIEAQIAAEARRVADALDAEVKIEADLEQSLRDDLARTKLTVSDTWRDTATLESLEQDARAKRDLLDSYLARRGEATTRPDAGAVQPDMRQITFAAPATTPVSPQTGTVLAAVGVLALALQVGGILFGELMSGRAMVERSYRRVEDAELPDEEPPVIADLFDLPDLPDRPEPEATAAAAGEFAFAGDDHEDVPGEADDVPPFDPEPDREPEPMPDAAAVAVATIPDEARFAAPRPVPARSLGEAALELSNLSADIALGRVRVVMLAALRDPGNCEAVADVLIADALRRGLSIVMIDAGGDRPSAAPGLTDLSHNSASFGDVVHQVREGLAEVPWGQEKMLDRRSLRPRTLVEALTDIYEVVIVFTGRIGMASTLPMFAGIACRLVLVSPAEPDRAALEAAVEDAANLGFEVGQIVRPPQRHTETV